MDKQALGDSNPMNGQEWYHRWFITRTGLDLGHGNRLDVSKYLCMFCVIFCHHRMQIHETIMTAYHVSW